MKIFREVKGIPEPVEGEDGKEQAELNPAGSI